MEVKTTERENYVPLDCCETDPRQKPGVWSRIEKREDLTLRLEYFLAGKGKSSILLLFAESGMGKTTVLRRFIHNRRRSGNNEGRKIELIFLGEPNCEEKIGAIEKPGETVLFLDAFDQYENDQEQPWKKLTNLLELCKDFPRILVASRPHDLLAGEEFGENVGGPEGTGDEIPECERLFIAPPSDEQIDRFVETRFPLWNWWGRRKGRQLVVKAPLLGQKPITLDLLPFLSGKEIPTFNHQIYEEVIRNWLGTSRNAGEEISFQALGYLAKEVFLKRGERREERISSLEGETEFEKAGIGRRQLEKLNGRLWRKWGDGSFGFTHRSFMEFLTIASMVEEDPAQCCEVRPTDQMIFFFLEMLRGGRIGSVEGLNLYKLDLRNTDLQEANLQGGCLREGCLDGAYMRGADLQKADLQKARLRRAYMRGASLKRANLQEALLVEAHLGEANMRWVHLKRAKMNKAEMQEAQLQDAQLGDADLRQANLWEAYLHRANMSNADMRGANLEKADLKDADLRGADLRGVIGLDVDQLCRVKSLYGSHLAPEWVKKIENDKPELLDAIP